MQVRCLIGPLTDRSVGQGLDVQLLTFFTGFHNDIAAWVLNAGQRQYRLTKQGPVLFNIGDAGFDEVVKVAGNQMALLNFRHADGGLFELGKHVGASSGQTDLNKDHEPHSQSSCVQSGSVVLDIAIPFEFANLFKTMGWAQIYSTGQLMVGNSGIGLQFV